MCCCWENKQSFFLSFFLSYETIPGIAQCSTKKITKKYSNNYYLVALEIYGTPYMKKVAEFRRNSGEFRRNFSKFRTEYGIDGSKKTGAIPCRRNSVDTLAASFLIQLHLL